MWWFGCWPPRGRRRRGWPGRVYGDTPGHPVVVARRHWAELRRGLRGDEGARSFLSARGDVVEVDCADLATGRDIDTTD